MCVGCIVLYLYRIEDKRAGVSPDGMKQLPPQLTSTILEQSQVRSQRLKFRERENRK